MIRRLAAAALIAFTASSTAAAQIYDNGAPDAIDGWAMSGIIQADDFTLTSGFNVTGIRFWGFSTDGENHYSGSITWSIFSNNAGLPGDLIHSGVASPVGLNQGPLAFSGNDQYQFDLATNFSLGAGTYWLGLYNGPFVPQLQNWFYWQTTARNSSLEGAYDMDPGSGDWVSGRDDYAFQLYGQSTGTSVVPEPSTYALFATGLIAIGFARRRRRA